MQHALAQQIKLCPPKHLALHELNACDMPLHRPSAPRLSERVPDGGFVTAKRCSECLEIRYTTGCTGSEPTGELRSLACAHHLLKLLHQGIYAPHVWILLHAGQHCVVFCVQLI
jgi:hypothetical protein